MMSIDRLTRYTNILRQDGFRCGYKGLGMSNSGRRDRAICLRLFNSKLADIGQQYIDDDERDMLFGEWSESWWRGVDDRQQESGFSPLVNAC